MGFLYEIAVLGAPSGEQVVDLERCITAIVQPFGLRLTHEIAWTVRPTSFSPDQRRASAAVFYGAAGVPEGNVRALLPKSIPVLPVVSTASRVADEIPEVLRPFNCLAYDHGGAERVATALLECAGLLPRQRRVFLSYRREEARQAAMQLFDALSARLFDVFLDTHGIAPADDFQAVLWHRLCDSDVLVMLDTPTYFDSRWTAAEFGRALAKGISVLQVGWPGHTPSARASTASRVPLLPAEVDPRSGLLVDEAVDRICLQLETVRSQSIAVRTLNLVSNLRNQVERIGGSVVGIGPKKAVVIHLADGRAVVVYPTVGVPTSTTLHDAILDTPGRSVAVVYDHVGLSSRWLDHLEWLGSHVRAAQWVKASEVGWRFADWGDAR